MYDWPELMDRIGEETHGVVVWSPFGGEDTLGIEEMLAGLVMTKSVISRELKTELAAFYGDILDEEADTDDDELMMWCKRENNPKFLAMAPAVPDPRQATPAAT